jgi:nicotinamide riboside transporter PnuC
MAADQVRLLISYLYVFKCQWKFAMLLGAIVGIVLFLWLQHRDDTRRQAEGRPLASTSKRVALFAVIVLVCGVFSHLLQNMGVEGTPLIRGGAPETEAVLLQHHAHSQMLAQIPDDVLVGRPPF